MGTQHKPADILFPSGHPQCPKAPAISQTHFCTQYLSFLGKDLPHRGGREYWQWSHQYMSGLLPGLRWALQGPRARNATLSLSRAQYVVDGPREASPLQGSPSAWCWEVYMPLKSIRNPKSFCFCEFYLFLFLV